MTFIPDDLDEETKKRLERFAEVDSLTLSPPDRAKRVLNFLKPDQPIFKPWDLICFCHYFLCYVSPHLLSQEESDILKQYKSALEVIDKVIIAHHYFGIDWAKGG